MTNVEVVEELFAAGATPSEAMKTALELGVPRMLIIKMFRAQFNLSLIEAKELMVNVETGKSLSQYQYDLFFGDNTPEEVEAEWMEEK